MNPLIKELQNAEWSRVFGPTNTLGGELVRVERERARMQDLQRERVVWRSAPPERWACPEEIIATGPMGVLDWIGTIVGLAVVVPAVLWLPLGLILAGLGVPASDLPGTVLWLLPVFYVCALAARIHIEHKKGRQRKAQAA